MVYGRFGVGSDVRDVITPVERAGQERSANLMSYHRPGVLLEEPALFIIPARLQVPKGHPVACNKGGPFAASTEPKNSRASLGDEGLLRMSVSKM